ncbi:hypothetical protein [Acuticoccus sp.]|uniref:hypothetical protein n=1 Tax=Acuticoccus sp. TaxID=1904378 RepID=UPI003B52F5BD
MIFPPAPSADRSFAIVPSGILAPFQPFVTTLVEELVIGDGVPGFELIGLDVDNLSVGFSLFGFDATLVLDGINDAVEEAETDDFNIFDDERQFAIFDVDDDGTFDLGPGEFISSVDMSSTNVPDIIRNALEEDTLFLGPPVAFDIIGIDQDNITLEITAEDAATDVLIIDGAEDEIADLAQDFVNLANAVNELGILDADDDDFIFVGDASAVSDEFAALLVGAPTGNPFVDAFNAFSMTLDEAEDVVTELVLGDGIDGVELLNIDDDTATLRLTGDSNDIVVVDNLDLSTLGDMAIA